MDEVQVVVAHSERATLRVGDVFLKVDADQARIDAEVRAMSLAPRPSKVTRSPASSTGPRRATALGRFDAGRSTSRWCSPGWRSG